MDRVTGLKRTPIVAIVGWKNSGKTTLVERLVAELVGKGQRVATVKHAHHVFQIDDGGSDSGRHRRAGAHQVAIVSPERTAIITELQGAPEPRLNEIVAQLEPCDIVLVEGYKREAVVKIEVRRLGAVSQEPLAPADESVIAVAADHPVDTAGRVLFDLDDIAGLAALIERVAIMPELAHTIGEEE